MSPPLDMAAADTPDDSEPMPETGGSAYAKAGRTIRHALADQDDEALAEAICKLVDIHEAEEPEEDAGPKGKPNLAALLLTRKRK